MDHHNTDSFDDFSHRRMFQEFEQSIREENRTAIRAATGAMTKERILRVAAAVSKLRARYLAEVIRLGDTNADASLDPTSSLDLGEMRTAYEEALAGFGALRHALERSYITLEDV